MKLETIKKDNKKRIIIGSMMVLSVVGCLTLTTTRAKYRNVQSLKLASGTVKINSKYDFKIMAMYQQKSDVICTDDNCYDTLEGRMPTNGYAINEEKSYCTIDGKNKDTVAILKTVNGHHTIENLIKNEKCYIWFDKARTSSKILMEIKLKSNGSYKGTTTPTFTSVATGAETDDNNGIYETDDPMYATVQNPNPKSYYWRGAATTNHVIFDNKCWRIVRINGDGSTRLIYNGLVKDGNICNGNGKNSENIISTLAYNSSASNSSYVGWTYTVGSQRPSTNVPQTDGVASTLKTKLELWYSDNIIDKSKIVMGKFCNDRNTVSGADWKETGTTQYYAAYARLMEGTMVPTLGCSSGDIYDLEVGLITADEVQFAGASGSAGNPSYYLYNGQRNWTFTPIALYGPSTAGMFYINYGNGQLSGDGVSGQKGIRPVINLRSDVTFNSGSDGTQNNPYIVQ